MSNFKKGQSPLKNPEVGGRLFCIQDEYITWKESGAKLGHVGKGYICGDEKEMKSDQNRE